MSKVRRVIPGAVVQTANLDAAPTFFLGRN